MLFGGHCSGGVKKAIARGVEIGAEAVQLFVQSPRAWRFPEHDPADLAAFRDQRTAAGIGAVLVHALYLVNLASPNEEVYGRSVETMCATLDASASIEADGVVLHVGSHQGAGLEAGLERAVPALREVLEHTSDATWLLLENCAGAGGTIGRSLEELATIVERLGRHPRLGVCLDSCHLHASGYDIADRPALDALLEQLDRSIGHERLRALHVNDSKTALGSNRDRHDNIGEGVLGEDLGVFLGHPALQALPAVLEVPGRDGHGPDAAEVEKLRALHGRWAGR